MPRGIFERKPRIWEDENGVRHESFGRPSKEEQRAKQLGKHFGLGETGVTSKPKEKPVETPNAEPPKYDDLPKNLNEMDVPAFLAAAEAAVENLEKAASISNHEVEKKYLGYFAKIIKLQMVPKYHKPQFYN